MRLNLVEAEAEMNRPDEICRACGWRREQHQPKTEHCPDRMAGWSKEIIFNPRTLISEAHRVRWAKRNQ